MTTSSDFDLEVKRSHLAVTVMKMGKNGRSQEEVNNLLRQQIAGDREIPEESKQGFFDSVMTEVQELVGEPAQSSRDNQTEGQVDTRDSDPISNENPSSQPHEPPAWVATLLAAIGLNQPVQPRKKKFLDPDTFDGSQNKYPVFKQQLKAKIDADPEDFPTAKKVYDYTLMRTTGLAARIMLSFIEHANKARNHSMEAFWDFLDSEFLDPHIVHKARDRLITISQGRRSVREYNADFREQLLLSGATLDEEYQIALFRRGLTPKLQELLASYEPSTYNDLVGKAIKTSDELYRASVLSKGKGQHLYASISRPTRTASSPPDPMDWEPTTANQGATQKRRVKWVTQEERQRRKDNRLCIQCGGDDHFVRNCPYERPLPPRVSKVGKSSVACPPLLDDAEDTDVDSEAGEE
jgi:hypothetical protein